MKADEAKAELQAIDFEIHELENRKRRIKGSCEHDKTYGEYDAWDRVTLQVCLGCGSYVRSSS